MNHHTTFIWYIAFLSFVFQISITWIANFDAISQRLKYSWILDPIALVFLIVAFFWREWEYYNFKNSCNSKS